MAKRLTLPQDRWIDIKEKLNVRDKRNVNTYSDLTLTSADSIKFDFYKNRIGLAAVRIVNWSDGMVDEVGNPIRWLPASSFDQRIACVERLEESILDDITHALAVFEAEQASEAVQAKNATPDGATDSERTTPSASS